MTKWPNDTKDKSTKGQKNIKIKGQNDKIIKGQKNKRTGQKDKPTKGQKDKRTKRQKDKLICVCDSPLGMKTVYSVHSYPPVCRSDQGFGLN